MRETDNSAMTEQGSKQREQLEPERDDDTGAAGVIEKERNGWILGVFQSRAQSNGS